MAKKITAWQTEDGRIYTTEWDAVQHDTNAALAQLLNDKGLNEAQVKAVLTSTGEIAEICEPLQKLIAKDKKARGG